MNNFVRISITGKNPKLFIKRVFINKINYHDYKEINHKLILLTISYDDYLKISKLSKSIYKIQIIKRYGILKYIYFIKNNLSFIICFLISLLLLFMINNLVFEIDVIHNDHKIRSLVKEELEEKGIKKYHFIPSFNKRKKIIEKIINENKNEIEWMEIEKSGNKLIIKITERRMNKINKKINNRHIIAKKSGIITKIEAQQGVILKKKNDYVTKGEIIISGDVIKDETVKGQVIAKGNVYAEVWYNVNVEYPLYYEEVKYLNEVKQDVNFEFFDKSFSLRKNYTDYYLERKNTIIKDKVFPFKISLQKKRKTKVAKEKLSSKKAILKAQKIATKKINSKLKKDEYIISKKTLNFKKKDSKIEVDVFFKVYENITDYKNTDPNLLKTPLNEN